MSDVDILSPKLLYDIGTYVGEIDTALQVCSSMVLYHWTCGTSVYNITNTVRNKDTNNIIFK